MTVWVDGVALASNIDIFKAVGLNTATSTSGTVTASGDRMNVTLTSAVRSIPGHIPVTSPGQPVRAVFHVYDAAVVHVRSSRFILDAMAMCMGCTSVSVILQMRNGCAFLV